MRNRMVDVLSSHPHITRILGDVCYDKDDNIVEVNESVVQAYIAAND